MMKSQGFTLIELMIVVVIVSILATAAIPAYSAYIEHAAHAEANIIIPDIVAKEKAYMHNWGSYIPVSAGYDGANLNYGLREAQIGEGLKDQRAWFLLGYSKNNDDDSREGAGIFGSPTYFKYAFRTNANHDDGVACGKRSIGNTENDIEFGMMKMSNQRAVVFTEGVSEANKDCQ